MAIKYQDNKNTTPQGGSRHHGTERPKYPSTIEYASKPSENKSKVSAGIAKRRPGGALRSHRGLSCTCGSHPCKCGTAEAKKFIINENVNE